MRKKPRENLETVPHYREAALLANTDPDDNRALLLKGRVGNFIIGDYASMNGTPWRTRFALPADVLLSLVDADAYGALRIDEPSSPVPAQLPISI